MKHATPSAIHFDELRLVTKGIEFLALITGVVYLSTVTGDVFLALRAGNLTWDSTVLFFLLLVATMSLLFATARWEGAGGIVATLCGVGLAIIVYLAASENQLLSAFLYSSPFIIAGILSLVYWRQTKNS